MKSSVSMLVMMAAVCLSACGGGGSTTPPSNANEWTWMNGANVVSQPGAYGALGTAGSSNVPGARALPLVGPMRPEISGSSVDLVSAQQQAIPMF
jgi:hypothetical protein